MKKKNGFTLVELLAVIVILAIIMVIAIPAVLDVMNRSRKSAFVLYAQKVIRDTKTQYSYDAGLGAATGAGYFVYSIVDDLDYDSTGDYQGYVVVNATNVDKPEYILFLYDNNYMILNYNVTDFGMPTTSDSAIQAYSASAVGTQANNAKDACTAAGAVGGVECYNRDGFVIVKKDE